MKTFWLGTITAIFLLLGSTAYAGDRHHHHHHYYKPHGRYYYGPAPRYYRNGYYRPAPRYYPVHDRYYRDGVGGHITVHF